MSKRRQERMSEEIKRILSRIIKEEIKDPRIDFSTVSITRAEVSGDLGHARVYFSVMGDEQRQKETIQGLQRARGYLRSELAKEIQVRHAPELEIRLDKSIEHGMRISSILDEINQTGEPE